MIVDFFKRLFYLIMGDLNMTKTFFLATIAISALTLCVATDCTAQACPAKRPQCQGLYIPLGQVAVECVNPSIKPVTDADYYREPLPSELWMLKPCISSYMLPTYTANGYDQWSRYVVTDTNPGPKIYKWKNYLAPRNYPHAPIMVPPPNAENIVEIPD